MLITGRLAHDPYWLKCKARLPLYLPSTKVGLLTSLKYENKNILFRSIRSAVNTAFTASWLVKMGTSELGELLRQGRTRRYINITVYCVTYVTFSSEPSSFQCPRTLKSERRKWGSELKDSGFLHKKSLVIMKNAYRLWTCGGDMMVWVWSVWGYLVLGSRGFTKEGKKEG